MAEFIEKLVLGRKHVANMDWVEGLWRVPKPVLSSWVFPTTLLDLRFEFRGPRCMATQ